MNSYLINKFGKEKTSQFLREEGVKPLTNRVGKSLTSFIAFPQRGNEGSSKWKGNLSPKVTEALLKFIIDYKKYYNENSDVKVIDAMAGSGSLKLLCNRLDISCSSYDLNPNYQHGIGGWNAVVDELPESADIIHVHPPYYNAITYSGNVWGHHPHPDDLSRCNSYDEFIHKLNVANQKLYLSLRKGGRLIVTVGDVRKNGKFYSIQNDMAKLGKLESFIVKAQYNCSSDNKTYKKPFIPIVTEYVMVFMKEKPFIVHFSCTKHAVVDIRKSSNVTWYQLIKDTFEYLGGSASLNSLNEVLANTKKAKNNSHFKDRIRATISENNDFVRVRRGFYKLIYAAN
ncbi:SAM-dependent methyltransferase (plasmid) [Vallitalea pronyensis]|uniref:SAM-dependent methyltransferase n=2 Tax=Vallitalea pronyensis TaxID=1348613 RepID=A0A8J8MRA9_9FIRM|nr:SAM-dependent methyltransferase [Vallitalea pronyensis]